MLYSSKFAFDANATAITAVTTADLMRHAKPLTGSQRACLAAALHDRKVMVEHTLGELAKIVGISQRYAQHAATLSAEQRDQILRNRDAVSLASILRARRRDYVPSDIEVRHMITRAGLNRVLLEAACMIESANITFA
jgi:hypothetical protein